MDDLRLVAARAWDLTGRRPVSAKELVEALYLRLRWFRPSEAEEIVGAMQKEGLLVAGPTPGTWIGAAELDSVTVPLTYRPPPSLKPAGASVPRPGLLPKVLAAIGAATGEDVSKLREETDRLSEQLGVLPTAAALLLGARRGLALGELLAEFDGELTSERPGH